MKRILFIDDEKQILDSVQLILETMGYQVVTHETATEGLQTALNDSFDLILVDIRMPEMNGAEVTEEILRNKPQASVLVLTVYPSDPLARRALESGACGLVRKPFEVAKILEHLEE